MSNALASRRAQIALLLEACRERAAARLTCIDQPEQALTCRFLALEPDGVLLEAPQEPVALSPQAACHVCFTHQGQPYRFRSALRGDSAAGVTALKIDMPLRIVPAEDAPPDRDALQDVDPIPAQISGILKSELRFEVRLARLTPSLSVTQVRGAAPRTLRPGDVCWLDFDLPGEPQRCELVVRLTRTQAGCDGQTELCWSTHPVEDRAKLQALFSRVARFAAQQRGHALCPAAVTSGQE